MIALHRVLCACEQMMECYLTFAGRDCDPVEEAGLFLRRLEAAGDAASSILRQHSGELSIVSRIYSQGDDEPMDHLGFHMTRAFIEKLHYFRLEFDLDQYVFPGESNAPREDTWGRSLV